MADSDCRSAIGVKAFALSMLRLNGKGAALALSLLIATSFTEGASLLLIVPLLHLLGPAAGALTIPTPAPLAHVFPALHIDLTFALCALVAAVTAQALLTRWKTIQTTLFLSDLTNKLRLGLFESISAARWSHIARQRTSDLHHALTADVDRVYAAAFHTLMLAQNAILLATYAIASLLISPPMTAFAAAVGFGALALLRPLRKRARVFGARLTTNHQEQYRTVSEFLAGVKIAKSFNAESRYVGDLRGTLLTMQSEYGAFVRANSATGLVFQITNAIALSIFVLVAHRGFSLPLPQIAALVFIFMRTAPRCMSLQTDMQQLLVNLPAAAAMRKVQDACDAHREAPTGRDAPKLTLQRGISLERVGFAYPERSKAALAQISATIPANRITAVIGHSGSGKSTLADLLTALLEPTSGAILIDGAPLTDENRREWRGRTAYVPQDVFLLHGTVAENLRLAAPGADEDMMWAALEAANAKNFVADLPDGLQTVLGDRGARLSGGERQRIALARALLRQPSLLVLDEATSALDWESQTLIAQAIDRLRGSMTIVAIAHQHSAIAMADWVIALQDGRLTETGAFDETTYARRSGRRALTADGAQESATTLGARAATS